MATEYKVIVEKEYYTLPKNRPTIGLLMMVKNEEKRIEVSLKSILNSVDAIIIYDTGSTDSTVDTIQKFAEKYKINLYVAQGQFVDYSTSRNVSLDFADTINVHYLLLLDANDELQGGEELKRFAKHVYESPSTGFLVYQHWWSGQHDKYFNQRFIKARIGWRYVGRVHEWMKDPNPKVPVMKMPTSIILYQDRTKDDNRSMKRFSRDKILLLEDHKENSTETRTLFYLSQTCQCLGEHQDALYYAKLRLDVEGFEEERFHSFMRAGTSCEALKHEWQDCMAWYIKAYEHSARAEPLVKIADHYRIEKKWHLAYMFAREACELTYPVDCILFVDNGVYDYNRWKLLALITTWMGKYAEGKSACLQAIQKSPNKEDDSKLLQFFLEKEASVSGEKKMEISARCGETRKMFVERIAKELAIQFPKLSSAQLQRKANEAWKFLVKKT